MHLFELSVSYFEEILNFKKAMSILKMRLCFHCLQFCFEIYAPNSGSVIKACKTDSDGKVVVGTCIITFYSTKSMYLMRL